MQGATHTSTTPLTSFAEVPTLRELSEKIFFNKDAEGNLISPEFYSAFAAVNQGHSKQKTALFYLKERPAHEVALLPLYEEACTAYIQLVTESVKSVFSEKGNVEEKKTLLKHLLRCRADTELPEAIQKTYSELIRCNAQVFYDPDLDIELQELHLSSNDFLELEIKEVLLEAANRWIATAQRNLGWMYLTGKGAEQNDAWAFSCFEKATQQEDMKAYTYLGKMYLNGWYLLGSTAFGPLKFGLMRQDSDKETAFAMFQKAADEGHAEAQYWFGLLCFELRTEEDASKKIRLGYQSFSAAAEQGHPKAQRCLGEVHLAWGEESTALAWFEKAAKQGDAGAQYQLGRLYWKGGWDIDLDESAACELLEKAAKQGHLEAQLLLEKMGISYEVEDIGDHLLSASQQILNEGNPWALLDLGVQLFEDVAKMNIKQVMFIEQEIDQMGREVVSWFLNDTQPGSAAGSKQHESSLTFAYSNQSYPQFDEL